MESSYLTPRKLSLKNLNLPHYTTFIKISETAMM